MANYYDIMEGLEELGFTQQDLNSYLISIVLSLAGYVLLAIGLYTIARRRGINRPWLAWIPVANVWLMGCISDQYQNVVKGQETSRRKWMLGLDITQIVLMIVALGVLVMGLVDLLRNFNVPMTDEEYAMMLLEPLLGSLGLMLLALIPSIALAIMQYMALYDIYSSCQPNLKVLYLVLSILFGTVMPLFVFLCRNKDLGMPARTYQSDVPDDWQSPPPVEPWDQQGF